jgi:hypothetical protein
MAEAMEVAARMDYGGGRRNELGGAKEMEKTRVDGFGSFSGVERFSILEVYSLFLKSPCSLLLQPNTGKSGMELLFTPEPNAT